MHIKIASSSPLLYKQYESTAKTVVQCAKALKKEERVYLCSIKSKKIRGRVEEWEGRERVRKKALRAHCTIAELTRTLLYTRARGDDGIPVQWKYAYGAVFIQASPYNTAALHHTIQYNKTAPYYFFQLAMRSTSGLLLFKLRLAWRGNLKSTN